MTHYWVAFECWTPEGSVEVVNPYVWVDAETSEQAELLARQKLRNQMIPGLSMTTCVPFSEEDYRKEMDRQKRIRSQEWHPVLN